MKIAVLGTGTVGRAMAAALAALGHDVVIGTRDPQATLARTEPELMGAAPFAHWHQSHGQVDVARFADATAGADLVVNATNGGGSLAALTAAGAAALLTSLGRRDVIDLGDITTARGAEMLLPIWLWLWGALGTADFNFKIAR